MLKQYITNAVVFITVLLARLAAAYTDRMDVVISNTPSFYYSHNCELTLSVISSSFVQYNVGSTESFLIKIMQSWQNTRFLPYFKSPLIYTNTSELVKQSTLDMCNRGNFSNNFTCVSIISNRFVYPQVKLNYNSTHSMYKFVLTNVVCPIQDVGPNKYHFKIQVQVPVSVNSSLIRMAGNYTYRFSGLKYRIIDSILANPFFTPEGQPVRENNTQVQARNYLVSYPSKLSIMVPISNSSELNNWQTVTIQFSSPLKSASINTSTCTLGTSQEIITPSLSNNFSMKESKSIPCSYSSTSNALTFTNSNYVLSSFMYNQAFNVYGLYQLPASRLNFSVDLTFSTTDTVAFYYRVTSQTASAINDTGRLVNVSTTTAILYESTQSPETIFGVNLTQYETIDEKYRVYCRYKQEPISANSSSISNIVTDPNLNSFIVALAILLGAILTVCIRKTLYKCQKYLFLIFVLSDFIIKIVLIAVIDNTAGDANKEVSFILSVFLAIQYLGMGTVLFFTYCSYILSNRQFVTKNTHHEEKRSRNGIFFMIFALLFNYKFYCICLFNIKLPSKMKTKRFKNQQLYIKYCWHLCLQILLILLQVFCVYNSCSNLAISLIFAIHQGVYVLLIALIGKSVYWMLAVKRVKKTIKQITQHVANEGHINTNTAQKQEGIGPEVDKNRGEFEGLEIESKRSTANRNAPLSQRPINRISNQA